MQSHSEPEYKKNSLSLSGTVAMGTGVMIGAGIFALTGQIAEFAGPYFPLAFLLAAIVSSFSAYTYIKMSNAYPSAGGIGMILQKTYGRTTMTGACALLMALSMIINESLVARTFGTYILQLIDGVDESFWISFLALGLILTSFLVNISGNTAIGLISKITAVFKIGGIFGFALSALWISGLTLEQSKIGLTSDNGLVGFFAGTALAVLAFKGFTTITNSGDEVENPKQNIGRAIILSLVICLVVYMTVALAVGSSLSIEQIIAAKDFSLAEASRPTFGDYGVLFTVLVAIIATSSGLLASMFAVSRMLTMLTKMQLIPHNHFGMTGGIQKHMLVYTAVLAGLLATLFDLSRIASLGAIFYLVMDMAIHLGVLRKLHLEINAQANILRTAILLDALVLTAFLWIKGNSDPLILILAIVSMGAIFLFEYIYLNFINPSMEDDFPHTH